MTDTTVFHADGELAELRRINRDLERRLRKAKAKTDDLVQATFEGARDAFMSLGAMPPVPTPKRDTRKKLREVALWHLTDWQGSKVTKTYNTQIMRDRIRGYCDRARKLTELQRAHHPVERCLIYFGGDMGEGLFSFPQQPYEVDMTIFEQYAHIARLEVEVVRSALSIYREVDVVSEWGNHGRIGSRRDAVPSSDNFDRMTYELARAFLKDSPGAERLRWEDSEEDVQRIEIGNYRALGIHGDEVGRNGFASRTTIVKRIGDWQAGAYDWDFRDAYVGHYHFHGEDPLPNPLCSVFWTGSPESGSRYASLKVGSGSNAPSQRLHFIDPDEGRVTAPYRVWL